MILAYRYRLKPTADQAAKLLQIAGAVRFVYNLALEQRRDFWRQYQNATGRRLNWAAQSLEVTQLRAQTEWLASVPRHALEQALRDLEKAFGKFFSEGAGYPQPRRRGLNDTFRVQAADTGFRCLSEKWSEVRVPNVGWVKFRDTRDIPGEPKNVTFSLIAGAWFVSVCTEVQPQGLGLAESVGADMGVAVAVTLSTGDAFHLPVAAGRVVERRKRAQRVLARRKRGSARYARQRRRVAALRAREARIRKDWAHRLTHDLSHRFGVVAIEDLKIRNMTASARGTAEAPGRNVAQKAGLNRSILAQGWGQIRDFLAYKMEATGGRLIAVDPKFTSQTCAACGVVDARSRKSQATFECVACDHRDNADVNAAKNILRRSTAWLDVEGDHFSPREASTLAA